MASVAAGYWRSAARRVGFARRLSTVPKMHRAGADIADHHHHKSRDLKADFLPIGVLFGLVIAALAIGAHTAKQQLVHSPGVRVSKKKRESMPEVEEPDHVAREGDRFLTKSFLRKVAHMQEFDPVRSGISDPTRANPYSHQRAPESLKSVGVNPRGH